VTATGMATEFGKIAEKIQEPEEETPLQRKLEDFGKRLGTVFVIVCIAIFLIGTLSGKEIHQMLLAALSLAVAAVPEGLPAAITIALAFGVIKMAKRKSIVKRLSAVEGLGSVDVICVDKTGTLTMNEMTVRKIWTPEGEYHVTGEGYSMKGKFLRDNKVVDLKKTKDLKFLLTASLACNDAIVGKEFIGDPTEIALAVLAKKGGISNNFVRVAEIPFDSQRKMMSVACRMKGGKKYIFTKGAVDEVIKKCKYVLKGNKKVPLRDKRKILEKNIEYAREAYRVIALAMAEMNGEGISEENLIFLGLVALFDPPRPEVKQAIERCKAAGIRVIMITGDHRETALAIAKEIGIVGKVITGEELEKMPKDKFEKEVEEIGIYARTTPQQKLKIIEEKEE
jgi:Ca2+-transporting ATPase